MYAWHAPVPVPDAHQRASQLCEAVSTWDKYPFQLFCTATERQEKATLGKKHLEKHRDLLREGQSFKLPQRREFLHDSCGLDLLLSWGKRVDLFQAGAVCTMLDVKNG